MPVRLFYQSLPRLSPPPVRLHSVEKSHRRKWFASFHSRCFGSSLSRIRSPKPASRLFRGALPRIQASTVHGFHLPHGLPRHQASKRFSYTFKSAAPVLCQTPCGGIARKRSRALSQNYLASSNDSSASIIIYKKIVFEFVPSKSIDLQNPLANTDFLRELGAK